jgi:catechol 2,3-dioxygenase-like lactoylglutathione lyase family enzyme
MRFHHMAVFVSDLQEAIHPWRDVMGFDLVVETEIPDGPVSARLPLRRGGPSSSVRPSP